MGKHTAADDSTVHPLVAAALSRRAGAPAGVHGEHSASTGWPEPERDGEGAVGWPDDTVAIPAVDPQRGGADRALTPVVRTAPLVAPRGWRRLFGASPAA